MLAGFDLVSPGLVDAVDWHPSGAAQPGEHVGFNAALARAPRRRCDGDERVMGSSVAGAPTRRPRLARRAPA